MLIRLKERNEREQWYQKMQSDGSRNSFINILSAVGRKMPLMCSERRGYYDTIHNQMFDLVIYVTGRGWPKYFPNSLTPLSFLSVFMYRGTHTDRNGMLAPGGNISSNSPS
jgi:hypothetical protein